MSWQIGGCTVYAYGLAVAVSAALALLLSRWTLFARPGTRSWLAVLGVPLAVIGARALYAACSWAQLTMDGVATVFRLTSGGFMLYGAALGLLAAVALTARITRQSFGMLLDGLAAPAALMLALCRLAEGLARQGFGWYVADWFSPDTTMSLFHPENFAWAERFPFAVQDLYHEWSWAVFTLEALIAVALLIVMLRTKPRRPGWRALLLALLYGASQLFCEALREDAVVRWGFIRANQVFSAFVLVAVVVICQTKVSRKDRPLILRAWLGLLTGAGVVIAMEFAVEQKIPFLRWMTADVCFGVIALGAAWMAAWALPLWRRSGER